MLSTGMAVDANVLVFERIKEEIQRGTMLKPAIETGFSLAWVAIRDSNVATLVICLVLWMFGRSFGASAVQGFALTLAIGVLISMFTAVVITRTLVRLFIGRSARFLENKPWLLGGMIANFNNFVQRRRIYYIFSVIIIGLGVLAIIYSYMVTGQFFRLGVDFVGGTRFEGAVYGVGFRRRYP
ncbi:MAG: MMPL family transporter [Chloroflexi bacterium]|nr:MMPL family transporter [Chloroflexota bacterium]